MNTSKAQGRVFKKIGKCTYAIGNVSDSSQSFRLLDKIAQTTNVKCILLNENARIQLKIPLKFVLRFELTLFQHWFR